MLLLKILFLLSFLFFFFNASLLPFIKLDMLLSKAVIAICQYYQLCLLLDYVEGWKKCFSQANMNIRSLQTKGFGNHARGQKWNDRLHPQKSSDIRIMSLQWVVPCCTKRSCRSECHSAYFQTTEEQYKAKHRSFCIP